MTTLPTLTYSVEFNPHTGDIRPFEIRVCDDQGVVRKGGSCKTLAGAEKAIKGHFIIRQGYYNCVYVK